MNRIMVCAAMLALGWVTPRMAVAECCNHCGCQCQCCKVCRLVPDVKKVPKVRYECECEDFCVPGPSCIVGYQCPSDDDCDCDRRKHPEPIWKPSCGCVRTRHKLVKIETMKEVKTYKCVVVNLCPHCCALNAKGQLPASNLCEKAPLQPAASPVAQAPVSQVAETAPSQYSQYDEGAESETPVAAKTPPVVAPQSEASDMQLVSHNSPSPPPTPSLISRIKRSVLGVKNSE